MLGRSVCAGASRAAPPASISKQKTNSVTRFTAGAPRTTTVFRDRCQVDEPVRPAWTLSGEPRDRVTVVEVVGAAEVVVPGGEAGDAEGLVDRGGEVLGGLPV